MLQTWRAVAKLDFITKSRLFLVELYELPKRAHVVDWAPHYKYSVLYHLEGLPPLCLLHGVDDELAPFSQSVQLAEKLERRGMPYEFYAYKGLSHYFSTRADDKTTQQMFQDSLDCLRRAMESG